MYRIACTLVVAIACASAAAQERTFLSKAETESLASGKKWTQTFADGRTVTWDLRANGTSQTNYETVNHRQGTANGNWTVDDDGQLCVKWNGGYPDRCVKVSKRDEKLRLVDSKSGNSSSLTVE